MPARPLTPAQRRENAAFLRALRMTGNARDAARAVGAHRAKFTRRRVKHPAFAQAWDAMLAVADARLKARAAAPVADAAPRLQLTRAGRLQVRRPLAGRLTREAQQRFLLALSATCNIRLAAAAAGFSHSAFYRLRERNPAFAREMRDALAQGHERLELALMESWSPASGDDAAWRSNDPPALPPMTPHKALHLLHLHGREVRWRETTFARRLLPGESSDLRSARMARLYRAKVMADAEAVVARDLACTVARLERKAEPMVLPDLAQVEGWSKAKQGEGGDSPTPLFDGNRNQRQTPEQREAARLKATEARRGGHAGGGARRKTRPARRASVKPATEPGLASGFAPYTPPKSVFRKDATPEEISRWLYRDVNEEDD